jgi:hypothetical protein
LRGTACAGHRCAIGHSRKSRSALGRSWRPFVIKEIEGGRLKCRLVNRHRRIEFEELVHYQEEQKQRSEAALKRLSDLSQEMSEAAAIAGHADAIVTFNEKDFPKEVLDPLGIEIQRPDEFVLNQLMLGSVWLRLCHR